MAMNRPPVPPMDPNQPIGAGPGMPQPPMAAAAPPPMPLMPEEDDDNSDSNSILVKYADEINLCSKIDKEDLQLYSSRVMSGFMEDQQSQAKWMSDTDDALKLAKLTKEPKNTPLPESANIKYPLITTACYQFAARTYPELIQDGKIVKTEITGQSNPMIDMIAYGVTTHMSHQILGSDSSWEAGMDKLLVVLPNIGFVVKKTYYDTINKKNVSEVCYYKDVVLRNDTTIMCINDLRRITHVLHVHPNDLIEGCRSGLYDEDAVYEIMDSYSQTIQNPECTLLEQHRFLDLDDDGYEEPYIVTVHKQSNKVLRVVARYTADSIEFNDKKEVKRITPIQYFTDYHFLPASDGSYMSVGFGSLMLHMNETINTILNQLIDAGTLANLQTGFMDSRIKFMGGQMQMEPGQWARVKGVIGQTLKDGVLPLNYKEPSTVLYQLLGLLLQSAKELTSSTDAMQGMQNATNVPATSMMAMIEQGMQMFSAIQRRLYRALKEEYNKLYALNGRYLDEEDYIAVLGPEYAALPNIYKTKAVKVIPVADPNLASDAQRMAQSQAIMALAGRPGINNGEVYMRYLQSLKIPNPDKLVNMQGTNPPDPKAQDMQAKSQAKMAEVQIKGAAQQLKEKEFAAKLSKMEAEITQMQANAMALVAKAQHTQSTTDVNEFNAKLEGLKTQLKATADAHRQMSDHNNATTELKQKQQELDQSHDRETQKIQQSQDQIDNDQSGQDNESNADGMDSTPSDSGDAPPNSGA